MQKYQVKINFRYQICKCLPIFKMFLAFFTTIGMQKDNKIIYEPRCEKNVFSGVFDLVPHELGCTVIEDG